MNKAFYSTALELSQAGLHGLPAEMRSFSHLIYSSPATLAFNSPGARGFGVKRAGLSIPGSIMLLVAPGCCGRNTSLFRTDPSYRDRSYFLLLDDTDIVTGRHLTKIPQAAQEIIDGMEKKPTALMICITCVDALLGTDMERVCRKVTERTGIPAVACYMYALTREKVLHPMAHIRRSVYSLLEPQKRNSRDMNILGFFTGLAESCELFSLMHSAGIENIREIGRCKSFESYSEMSRANFDLVLAPEARHAAIDMQKRLGIPFIEMLRLYRPEKIANQYMALADALDVKFDISEYHEDAKETIESFRNKYPDAVFSVGEVQNGDPLEMALMLCEEGFEVREVFATVGEMNFPFLERLAQLSPDTRIYSNLSPTMLYYEPESVDLCIGCDSGYYHGDVPCVEWSDEEQPFGFDGVKRLFSDLLCSAASDRIR